MDLEVVEGLGKESFGSCSAWRMNDVPWGKVCVGGGVQGGNRKL